MSYHQLFERAYALCVKFNHPAIYDIATMNENELQGLIYFFTSMMSS